MMVTPDSIDLPEGVQKKPVGSVMVVEASTLEEVKKMMESDIYFSGGVVSLEVSS